MAHLFWNWGSKIWTSAEQSVCENGPWSLDIVRSLCAATLSPMSSSRMSSSKLNPFHPVRRGESSLSPICKRSFSATLFPALVVTSRQPGRPRRRCRGRPCSWGFGGRRPCCILHTGRSCTELPVVMIPSNESMPSPDSRSGRDWNDTRRRRGNQLLVVVASPTVWIFFFFFRKKKTKTLLIFGRKT